MHTSDASLAWANGVRGLAALVVVLWHAVLTVVPDDPTPVQHVFMLGLGVGARWSVLAFIVLSGFLLGNHWDGDVRRFFARRCWRILPPYWAALVITVVAMLLLGLRNPSGSHWDSNLPLTWDRTISSFLLITDVRGIVPLSHPLWTVPVEFHLYLLAPLVVLVRREARVLAAGTAASIAIALVADGFIAPHYVLAFAAAFWLGLNREGLRPLRSVALISVGFASIAAIALFDGGMSESAQRYLVADAVGAPAFLWWFLRGARGQLDGLHRALGTRVPLWLGSRSYSLYLIHAVVLELIWRAGLDRTGSETVAIVAMMVIGAAASVLAADGLYRAVERPSIGRAARVRHSLPRDPKGVA